MLERLAAWVCSEESSLLELVNLEDPPGLL